MAPRLQRARSLRLLLGISVFWLALSILADGVNSLVLPKYLLDLGAAGSATTLGLFTFGGLTAGMLVQPIAGQWSDRLRHRYGRHVFVGFGLFLLLGALLGFGLAPNLAALFAAYLAVQIAAGMAQAAQQGYIPDLVSSDSRGLAAGIKGLMDTGGATIGFILLGGILAGDSIAPALVVIAAALAVTYLLAILLVREPTIATSSKTRSGLLDAFRLDIGCHGLFVRVVIARFLFLLGPSSVGRFLLFFIADRLGFDPGRAAEEAGMLLAALTLVTALAAPLGGWAADRWGRVPLMVAGALLSTAGVLGLITASSSQLILLYGGIMAVGSAAFAGANWALTTEFTPPGEAARFMGLANFGTAGGAAAAGLLGPLVDWGNTLAPGRGYSFLFLTAAAAFLSSILVLRRLHDASNCPLPDMERT
jgi:MFS family permease